MTLKELHEKRAKAGHEIQELAKKSADTETDWTSDDEARWAAANKEHDDLDARIERAERAERLDAYDRERAEEAESRARRFRERGTRREIAEEDEDDDAPRSGVRRVDQKTLALALQGWFGTQLAMAGEGNFEARDRHVAAAARCGFRLEARSIPIGLLARESYREFRSDYERRAQSTAATEGGDTIPEGFVPSLERALLAFGGMREVSNVLRTAGGNDLPIPTADDTSNEGAAIDENTQVTEQDAVTGALVMKAWKYTSKAIRVSQELLEDSAIDFAAFIGTALGERLARIANRKFTVGAGTTEPKGVMVAGTVGKTAAVNNAITFLEILDFIHSVDPAYRGNATMMMHDSTILALRKIVDDVGQFIWQPAPALGVPQTISGYPVVVNQHIDAIAATKKVIAFGDFSKYLIREVAALRLKTLVERYADYDQVGFIAFNRFDGNLLDAGTHPVKTFAMPA